MGFLFSAGKFFSAIDYQTGKVRFICLLALLAVFLGGAVYMAAPAYVFVVVVVILVAGIWRLEWGLVALALSYSYALPLIRTPVGWSAFIRADDIAISTVLVSWLIARRARVRELLTDSPLTKPLLTWIGLLTISTSIGYAVHGETRA